MTTPHTPGPWKVAGLVGFGIWITDETANNQIAVVYGERQNEGARQNASLIAAAPSLLKVAKLALAEFQRISYQKKADPQVLDIIRKVIAKAEGE